MKKSAKNIVDKKILCAENSRCLRHDIDLLFECIIYLFWSNCLIRSNLLNKMEKVDLKILNRIILCTCTDECCFFGHV